VAGHPRVRRARPGAVDVAQLERREVEVGEWDRRFGYLRTLDALDVGLRLVKAELS
jgi:hypothetical protein